MSNFLDQEFPEQYFDDAPEIIADYRKNIIKKFQLKNNLGKEFPPQQPLLGLFLLINMTKELTTTSRGLDLQLAACLSVMGYKDNIVIAIFPTVSRHAEIYMEKQISKDLLNRLLLLIQRMGFRKTLAILKNKKNKDFKCP